jgi:hypothetical protein
MDAWTELHQMTIRDRIESLRSESTSRQTSRIAVGALATTSNAARGRGPTTRFGTARRAILSRA